MITFIPPRLRVGALVGGRADGRLPLITHLPAALLRGPGVGLAQPEVSPIRLAQVVD